MDAIFKEHPNLKEYFQTSDEEKFYQETDARNHAKSLEDKTVVPFKREIEKSQVVEEDSNDDQIIYNSESTTESETVLDVISEDKKTTPKAKK